MTDDRNGNGEDSWTGPIPEGLFLFVLGLYFGRAIAQELRNLKVDDHSHAQLRATSDVRAAVTAVESATAMVNDQVEAMARETTRAQRLAIWVGVVVAISSALLGGFAGAYAAKIVGN